MDSLKSPHIPSIHIFDHDSTLNMFYLYRPSIFDGLENDRFRIGGGKNGTVNDGCTNSHKFAEDGET